MNTVADSLGVSVKKGWVREGILRNLARNPSTLTSLASALGVSKSTVNYHLSSLLSRGAIEIVDTKVGRGGVVSNEYALKQGSLVLLPSIDEERKELRSLEEVFDVETLTWATASDLPSGEKFEVLLYKLFLHLFRISKSEHRALLRGYGHRAGTLVSHSVSGGNPRESIRRLAREMARRGIASARLLELTGTRTVVLISGRCLSSSDHRSYGCYFLEGLVAGVLQTRYGAGQTVERLELDLSACCLVVGRPKHTTLEWVKEAVLSQPVKFDEGSAAEEEGGKEIG